MPSASIREVSAHFPARGILFADRNECVCRLTHESGIANGHEESEEEDDGGEGVDRANRENSIDLARAAKTAAIKAWKTYEKAQLASRKVGAADARVGSET